MADIRDVLNRFTRLAMDEEVNLGMLAEDITLFKKLALDNPRTVKGADIAINVMHDEHEGLATQTGQTAYPFTVKNVYGTGKLQWTRHINGMGIDGFIYEENTGRVLEDDLSRGMEMVGDGSAMTLINLYKHEAMATLFASQRKIGREMYGDGSGDGGAAIGGLNAMAHPDRDYGGKATSAFGYHSWTLPLENPGGDVVGGKLARWSPIFKDLSGSALSVYGDLQAGLIGLNHGGSIHSMETGQAGPREFWGFCSQKTHGEIEEIMRETLSRDVTENSDANSDIGAFSQPIVWKNYRSKIFPDTQCPDDEIYVFNRYCVQYLQQNDDQKYVGKWRLGETQDFVGIPYRKMHQMWTDDRSQILRFSNFNGITS